MSIKELSKLLKFLLAKKKYDLYEKVLNRVRNGEFNELGIDLEIINFEDLDPTMTNVDLLEELCHGFFINSKYSLVRKAFERMHNICFINFNNYNDQELKGLYELIKIKNKKDTNRERIIEILKQSYQEKFIIKERNLLKTIGQSEHDEIKKIYELCAKSPNIDVRAICCASINNTEIFKDDQSKRIKKIVDLKKNLNNNINSLSFYENSFVQFFLDELNNNRIKIYDEGIIYPKDEENNYMSVILSGPTLGYQNFIGDRDIYWNINDKRLIAYDLTNQLKKGVISISNTPKNVKYLNTQTCKHIHI